MPNRFNTQVDGVQTPGVGVGAQAGGQPLPQGFDLAALLRALGGGGMPHQQTSMQVGIQALLAAMQPMQGQAQPQSASTLGPRR